MKYSLILLIIALLNTTYSPSANSHDASLIIPKESLWEGVDGNLKLLKVLQFKNNGEHYLYSFNTIKGFSQYNRQKFSDSDIRCSKTECSIELYKKHGIKTQKLIITPDNQSTLDIVEINLEESGEVAFTSHYRLIQQKSSSIARRFLTERLPKIKRHINQTNTIEGFWIGSGYSNGEHQILTLELYAGKNVKLTQFVSGTSLVYEDSFELNANNLEQTKLYLTTSKNNGTVELTLYNLNNFLLQGFVIFSIDGHAIRNSNFELYKLKVE